MKKIHMTLFSALVLVIIGMTLFRSVTGKGDGLFDQGTSTNFYAEAEVGQGLDIKPSDYFGEGEYKLEKFTFDDTEFDGDTEGTYRIPVFYDGKQTNCQVLVTVKGKTPAVPETREGLGDGEIMGTAPAEGSTAQE